MGRGAASAITGPHKKLIEAGYILAKGSGGQDGLAEDSEYINLPDEWLKRDNPNFEVYPECWDAFELFQMCATQWRISPMGERTGLDYTAVIALAKYLKHKPDIFMQVRYLELGAMTAYSGKELEVLIDG